MTYRVRPAVETDLPEIVAIERLSFGDPWSEQSFRAMLGHSAVHAFVAEQDGTVLGYCVAWVVADEAEVANVAVAPSARRRGVAAALLDALLALIDARPVTNTTVYLEVRAGNTAARALYEGRGFTATGSRKAYYRAPVEDAVVMRREASHR